MKTKKIQIVSIVLSLIMMVAIPAFAWQVVNSTELFGTVLQLQEVNTDMLSLTVTSTTLHADMLPMHSENGEKFSDVDGNDVEAETDKASITSAVGYPVQFYVSNIEVVTDCETADILKALRVSVSYDLDTYIFAPCDGYSYQNKHLKEYGTKFCTNASDMERTITIRYWFEGLDDACTTENINAMTGDIGITINFTAVE